MLISANSLDPFQTFPFQQLVKIAFCTLRRTVVVGLVVDRKKKAGFRNKLTSFLIMSFLKCVILSQNEILKYIKDSENLIMINTIPE